jgi:plasmid stability protein
MCIACDKFQRMGMIQIRNVPDSVHRRLKARAAEAGMTLSDYLARELERIARIPTDDEIRERLRRLPPVELEETPAAIIRRMRESA